MKITFIISAILILITDVAFSQNKYQTLSERDSIKDQHQKTIYYLLQESWLANKEPSYAAVLPYTPSIGNRRIPLRQGEGAESDFDLLEANLDFRFPLFLGKTRGSGFKRSQRITFDYNGTFRMTLDESKPIIPGSHKFGLSYYLSIYNNYIGWINPLNDPQAKKLITSENKNFNFVNLLLRLHHYSDGQATGFTYTPDVNDPSNFRNSYLDGDFSTNYFYIETTFGGYGKTMGSLHQLSLGYRRDMGTDDSTFAFTKNQEKAYGRDRLQLKYDYRTKRFDKFFEYHVRLEIEQILGNLDSFQANLVDDSGKYRTGARLFFELAPKNHRSVGYFVSGYYGRDYLNIRYDDIVFSAQVGVTFAMDKFYMPELN